jgi:hypothetical protein
MVLSIEIWVLGLIQNTDGEYKELVFVEEFKVKWGSWLLIPPSRLREAL